ncbi:hypothetical protein GCM10023188_37470 [Pontibacter saemangeumensis]|uniref:DUF3592 domain-containing protein n=1 Tax=Pontibacter saemangeumensis TaxID=1084525 RepID=A0ABP8M182_9BACT
MKLKNWIQIVLLVGLISLGIGSAFYEKFLLDECSKDWKATVVDMHERRKRGYYMKYQYYVNGKKFSSTEPIRDTEVSLFNVGDTINITVSCSYPDVSSYKPIEGI